MWEGFTGKRRKNGLLGLVIGIVVSSILLYLSITFIPFLYLLIPVLLLVIFHYTGAWRFSDRAFYGFIAIVVAFIVAMAGATSLFPSASHQGSSSIYDVNYSYYNDSGNYVFNFTYPTENYTSNSIMELNDWPFNSTILSTNATAVNSGANYSFSWNAGHLPPHIYSVFIILQSINNTSRSNQTIAFLGPVLVSQPSVMWLLIVWGFESYLLITFLFYLAFAFFARAVSTSKRRKMKEGDQNPPVQAVQDQPILETGQEKRGLFGRRKL